MRSTRDCYCYSSCTSTVCFLWMLWRWAKRAQGSIGSRWTIRWVAKIISRATTTTASGCGWLLIAATRKCRRRKGKESSSKFVANGGFWRGTWGSWWAWCGGTEEATSLSSSSVVAEESESEAGIIPIMTAFMTAKLFDGWAISNRG